MACVCLRSKSRGVRSLGHSVRAMAPIEQFARALYGGKSHMTGDEMLVAFFNGEADIGIPFMCAGHSPKLRQTVEESVLHYYTGV